MKSMGVSPAFLSVTTLFFAWGFITSNNDPLIAALKASFNLTYTEALFTQLVSFAAYGIVSFPAAALLARVGALRSILLALATMICGCVLVQMVARFQQYELFLAGLFVLGGGITILQVAANPLATMLGPPESSHFRLTFAQAFNSLGVVIGVSFGSRLMLSHDVIPGGHSPIRDPGVQSLMLEGVAHAFAWMSVLLVGLMAFMWLSRRRMSAYEASAVEAQASPFVALRSRWAVFGAVAIGLYVGAEVSISSVMINFLNQESILDISLEAAGFYLANVYWMGALIGRFVGSYLLTRVAAPPLLGGAAGVAALFAVIVAFTTGTIAAWAALGIGLFNSIMFPTIFSITLERAGGSRSATSGLLCLAIVGGAALPYAVGLVADHASLSTAFFIPAVAYGFIALFAVLATRSEPEGTPAF